MDTTIKVDSQVRDRLARLARERGTTLRELVSELANNTPTAEDLKTRAEAAVSYVRARINPDLSEADLSAAERFWMEIESGRVPDIDDMYEPDRKRAA
ncbi:hypothetical protein KBX50_09010 [Micromonospora sp. C51]|uniref:hypothetical protein n=1 Tax=Micromonospora sp. C51 TaxID=2824879 RepID=UPI001B38113C|nr:hypothetical protein [Micromonospora sp. C51]MBQ1048598.1 hypothetical protein [Micromonospora sp. C51]